MFADDCTLLQPIKSVASRNVGYSSLQADLDNILSWAALNQMKFAAHKTQSMTISRRKDRATGHLQLTMSGEEISEVSSLKLLGVEFAENGSTNGHILAKAATAAKLVGMLRRQSKYFTERARQHIYVATIRPHLEYSSPVFVNAPAGTLRVLERVQQRAAKLFPSVVLDSMELRRNIAGLCQLFKIIDNSAPISVMEHIKPKFASFQRTTRLSESVNLRALEVPKSRTEHHKRSFLPTYSRLWNKLGNETVFANSVANFKKRACREMRTNCSNTG